MEREDTHETDVCEELWEYPDAWTGDDDGDDVENEADDGEGEEEANETQHADAEVPDAETHDGRPEGEHDTTEDDGDHDEPADVGGPLGTLVEPGVVLIGGKHLLGYDREGFRGRGRPGGTTALYAQKIRVAVDGLQNILCVRFGGDFWDVFEFGVCRGEEGGDG